MTMPRDADGVVHRTGRPDPDVSLRPVAADVGGKRRGTPEGEGEPRTEATTAFSSSFSLLSTSRSSSSPLSPTRPAACSSSATPPTLSSTPIYNSSTALGNTLWFYAAISVSEVVR